LAVAAVVEEHVLFPPWLDLIEKVHQFDHLDSPGGKTLLESFAELGAVPIPRHTVAAQKLTDTVEPQGDKECQKGALLFR
jgi:hypothetical protein